LSNLQAFLDEVRLAEAEAEAEAEAGREVDDPILACAMCSRSVGTDVLHLN